MSGLMPPARPTLPPLVIAVTAPARPGNMPIMRRVFASGNA